MHEFGVPESNIVLDKQSGNDSARPGLRRLVKKMKPEDVLVIKSIDWLGKSYEENLEQWRYLTKKQVAIVVLDISISDTQKDRNVKKCKIMKK